MTNLNTLVGFGAGGSGGGGSSSSTAFLGSQIDTLTLNNKRGYTDRRSSSSYSGFAPAASQDLTNNRSKRTFYFWTQSRDPSNNYSAFTVNTFTIDKATGQVSQTSYGAQDIWQNTSGAALSTTYLVYDPTYGTFFSGGHNAYPGYSSHVFGHTTGYVRDDGYASGYASYTNTDHGYNGTYCGCLSAASGQTNFYLTGGYDSSSGSYAGNRVIAASSVSNPSVGSFSTNGSWTSSSSAFHHAYQPDHNTGYNSGNVVSMHATSGTSPNYKTSYLWAGGSSKNISQQNYASTYAGTVWGTSSGTTFFYKTDGDFGYYDTNSNFNSLADGYPDFTSGYSPSSYPPKTHGIGDDCYIYTADQNSSEPHVTFYQVNPSTRQPQKIADLSIGTGNPAFMASSSSAWFFVWQNDSDTHPKWAVRCYNGLDNDMGARIDTFEITADFAALKA